MMKEVLLRLSQTEKKKYYQSGQDRDMPETPLLSSLSLNLLALTTLI